MGKFLAYFDLLGYKKFVENNTEEDLDRRTNHFGRNIEMALALEHPHIQSKRLGVAVSDISHSTLNCLTFSDTVILWTNSNTLQEFEEILRVAYKYNHFNVLHDFPSRGCIVYGDIWFKPFDSENMRGGKYMLNMIYGNALIQAHLRAEAMSWAGCELSSSAIEFAKTLGNIDSLLQEHTMIYDIPFKINDNKEIREKGQALRLSKGNLIITKYMEESISRAFTQDNKGAIEGRTKVIFDNTINFLKAHQITFPFCYYQKQTSEDTSIEIFGKLEENYTHTIIRLINGNNSNKFEIQEMKFDLKNSDRDFLEAETISLKAFEEQFEKAKN